MMAVFSLFVSMSYNSTTFANNMSSPSSDDDVSAVVAATKHLHAALTTGTAEREHHLKRLHELAMAVPRHRLPLMLAKEQVRRLVRGKAVTMHHEDIRSDCCGGAVSCWVPKHTMKKALKAVQGQRGWRLKLDQPDVEYNVRRSAEDGEGAGFGDFLDKVADFGRKAIDVVDKVISVGNQIVQLLPPVHPYIVSLQKGLAVAAGITSALNQLANKREELQAVAAEQEADVYEYKAAAKEPGLSEAQKHKLSEKAQRAKERLAAAKAKIKETSREEKKLKEKQIKADKEVRAREAKVKMEAAKQGRSK